VAWVILESTFKPLRKVPQKDKNPRTRVGEKKEGSIISD
jgi:hypothetical protein